MEYDVVISALPRVGVAVLLLVALLLSPSVPVVSASHSGSLEEELAQLVNSTQIAQWVFSEGLVGTDYARHVFDRLATCSSNSKLTFIAQSLEGATVSASQGMVPDTNLWRRDGRALIALIMEDPGSVSGCDSKTIYEAVLLALGQPTPLGILLPSRSLLANISAYIAYSIVSRAVPRNPRLAEEAALIASHNPMAGYALLALYGVAGQEFWERVLGNASTASSLCLVFSFTSPDHIPEPIAKEALALITGPYYVLGPSAEVWLASRLYGAPGALFCFVAVTRLLDAAYPDYVSILARLPMYRARGLEAPIPAINGSMDALQILMASRVWNSTLPGKARLATVTRMNESIIYSPSALAAVMTRLYRYKPTPLINETNRSLACRLAETMIDKLLNSSQPSSQLAWDIVASATSLCTLETGDLEAVERLLLYQPFAPIDPWTLSLAVAAHTEPGTRLHTYAQQLAGILWSNEPWRVLGAEPPSSDEEAKTLYNLVVAGLEAWRNGLRPGILLGNTTSAKRVLPNSPGLSPRSISVTEDLLDKIAWGGGLTETLNTTIANITGGGAVAIESSLGQEVSRGNISRVLERIGLVARMLSLRPLGNGTDVLDVASLRALSSLLVASTGAPRESLDKAAEVAIGGANVSELVTSTAPQEGTGQSHYLARIASWSLGLNPSPQPPGTRRANETMATSIKSLADRVEKLARSISNTGYGEVLRKALAEIARTLRSNDYAATTMYSQRLRELANILSLNKPEGTNPSGASMPRYNSKPLDTETRLVSSNEVNYQQLLDELAKITQSAATMNNPLSGYTSATLGNTEAPGEKTSASETSTAHTPAKKTTPITPSKITGDHGGKAPGRGTAPSQAIAPQLVSHNKLLQELQESLKKHDTRKAALLLEKIATSNNEELKAKALQLLGKEDSETLSELIQEIVKQARLGEISGKESRLLSSLLDKLSLKSPGAPNNNEFNIPRISIPSGSALNVHPPRVSPPSISPPPLGASSSGLQWLLLAVAIGLIAVLLARGLKGATVTVHKLRIRKLQRQVARAKMSKEQAGTLRDLVIALYAEVLKLYSKLYRPKAPGETHREYAYALPSRERPVYEPVSRVYERAKFSFNPVTTEDADFIERSLGELRRRIEKGDKKTRRKR